MSDKMNLPESFHIVSLTVVNDTIPFYLRDNIASKLSAYNSAGTPSSLESGYNYSGNTGLYESAIRKLCSEADNRDAYIALLEYTADTRKGDEITNEAVLILTDDDNPEVVNWYPVNSDLVKNLKLYKKLFSGAKDNKGAAVDNSSLNEVEQFILQH